MASLNHIPALAIQPENQDPINSYGKLQNIQALAAQQKQQQALMPGVLQRQQQELEAGLLDNQAKQRQAAQADAMNKAFQMSITSDPTTGQPTFDRQKVLSTIAASNQGALVPQLTQTFNAIDKQAADLADLKDKHIAATQDYFGSLAAEVRQANYAPGALGIALAHATANGYGAQAQQIQKQYAQNPDSIKQWVDQAIAGSPKQRELAAQEMAAQARKKQSEKVPNETGAQADQEYQDIVTKQKLGQALTPQEQATKTAYEQRKTLGPRTVFELQQNGAQTPPVAPLNPDGSTKTPEQLYPTFGSKAGVVKGIVEGRQTMPGGAAMRSPYWQDVENKVYQVDPQWSEERAQIRKAFTTGKDGTNIGNLNTAAVHLDVLGEAAKAMDNGTFKPGNDIYNKIRTIFGSSAPTTADAIKTAASGEMASALKGNATDPEIAQLKKNYDTAGAAPGQIAGVIDAHLGIIGQKLQTYKERYEQQNPGDQIYSPVLPSAQKVFEKHVQPQLSGKDFGAAPAGKTDGATGKLPDGTKVVVKGGRLVAQ